MRGDRDAAGDGSSLLVVIDMQRIFGDPESPWFTPGYAGIVPNVDRLVEAFGDRVVFTRFLVPDEPRGSWAAYYERFPEVARPEARPLFALTEPWAGRRPPTLDVPTFSKWGPSLRARAGPAETLVLAGVATDCCVIGTALPAADAGNSNPDNLFRFQAGTNPCYQYNLKTPKGLSAGTYLLFFEVEGDPIRHAVQFTIK